MKHKWIDSKPHDPEKLKKTGLTYGSNMPSLMAEIADSKAAEKRRLKRVARIAVFSERARAKRNGGGK